MENDLDTKMIEIDTENCLNVLVTSYFLQLTWVYERIWRDFFVFNFSHVINNCRISLSNINPAIVKDIAEKVAEL